MYVYQVPGTRYQVPGTIYLPCVRIPGMPGIYQVPEKIYLPCVRISGYIYHARISGIMYLERFTMCTYIRYATDELWIPSTSEFKSNKAWKNDHFSKNTRYKTFTCWHVCAKDNRLNSKKNCFRYENILFKGENVLTPKTLQQVEAISLIWIQNSLKLSTMSRCTWSTRRW